MQKYVCGTNPNKCLFLSRFFAEHATNYVTKIMKIAVSTVYEEIWYSFLDPIVAVAIQNNSLSEKNRLWYYSKMY